MKDDVLSPAAVVCLVVLQSAADNEEAAAHTHTSPPSPPTLQEGFHGSAVGHVDGPSSGVGGEGGVCATGQQETHHLDVVVLHGVMQRPDEQHKTKSL